MNTRKRDDGQVDEIGTPSKRLKTDNVKHETYDNNQAELHATKIELFQTQLAKQVLEMEVESLKKQNAADANDYQKKIDELNSLKQNISQALNKISAELAKIKIKYNDVVVNNHVDLSSMLNTCEHISTFYKNKTHGLFENIQKLKSEFNDFKADITIQLTSLKLHINHFSDNVNSKIELQQFTLNSLQDEVTSWENGNQQALATQALLAAQNKKFIETIQQIHANYRMQSAQTSAYVTMLEAQNFALGGTPLQPLQQSLLQQNSIYRQPNNIPPAVPLDPVAYQAQMQRMGYNTSGH